MLDRKVRDIKTAVYLSNRTHFLWIYRRDNPRGMFSGVFPTSQVAYHAGKPIESLVYCFYKITLSKKEFSMSLPAQQTISF